MVHFFFTFVTLCTANCIVDTTRVLQETFLIGLFPCRNEHMNEKKLKETNCRMADGAKSIFFDFLDSGAIN